MIADVVDVLGGCGGGVVVLLDLRLLLVKVSVLFLRSTCCLSSFGNVVADILLLYVSTARSTVNLAVLVTVGGWWVETKRVDECLCLWTVVGWYGGSASLVWIVIGGMGAWTYVVRAPVSGEWVTRDGSGNGGGGGKGGVRCFGPGLTVVFGGM